jgi:protein SCO1
MKRHVAWILLLIAMIAHAQISTPPQTEFLQNLNAQLPLQTIFTNDRGNTVHLADYFGQRPVVLVLGYYHCPNLCSTLMDGVLQSLAAVNLPRSAYRFLAVSIDPTETVELAARKKVSYMPMLGRRGGDVDLLTGDQRDIARLASVAGFQYRYDASLRQYMHPAGFLVATGEGRISHYFMGVRFDPKDVRLALIDASAGRIGSPVDRLLLLCSHYDPATGRYSIAVMTWVRIVCLSVLILIIGWIWMHRPSRLQR